MNKRTFFKSAAMAGAGLFTIRSLAYGENGSSIISPLMPGPLTNSKGEYILPPLDYPYNALEPHIDEQTMRLHHDKHHAGYVKGLNKATQAVKTAIEQNDYALIKYWERELAFHGSGHVLHSVYWKNMTPKTTRPSDTLKKYINRDFGSLNNFISYFSAASKKVEGSGWGILAYQTGTDKLVVLQAEKHQNLSQWISVPILVCDVWEHAYYLKYQNKRADYIRNFMDVVNWDDVGNRLDHLLSLK